MQKLKKELSKMIMDVQTVYIVRHALFLEPAISSQIYLKIKPLCKTAE